MKILLRNQGEKEWRLVESAAYGKEGELQHLLAESPSLISINDVRPEAGSLVLAVREFGLPIGAIDLLAFSARGDIAIIECKLAANQEIKRKVIGQVLEYGANLWEMTYEDLDQGIRLRTGKTLAEAVEGTVKSPDWDEEAFRGNVEAALANGNFILIIVVDEINDPLGRIVRYINVCGNPNFDFAALEMRRFQSGRDEILVPRVFGPTHTAKSSGRIDPGKQWDESTFFAELQKRQPESVSATARQILEWSKRHAPVWWGKGSQLGSFVPRVVHKDIKHQLFAVWTYGVVEIYFYWFSFKPPFDAEGKRMELFHKLNEIEGVNLPADAINRRPSIPLSSFSSSEKVKQFSNVFEWVIEEIKRT